MNTLDLDDNGALRQEIGRLQHLLCVLLDQHPGCLLPAYERTGPCRIVPVADILEAGVKALGLVVLPKDLPPAYRALYAAITGGAG
jgi:hypothetical protein